MYLKKILLAIVIIGLLIAGGVAYWIYNAILTPNTAFSNEEAYVYIKSDASFNDVKKVVSPLLKKMSGFEQLAKQRGYANNIKPGKYAIKKGANNREIINMLRIGNMPIKVSFNNQETLANLAGRISEQIEADSVSLLNVFNKIDFLEENGFTKATQLAMYVPNSYELYWNTSAEGFRDRMLKEYHKFWNVERLEKAKKLNLSPFEIMSLASIVHKETAKVDERPRVAGLYLNRIRKRIPLQADPTVIYAIKEHSGNFDQVIKRVLYKDLELDSPYNTYKYAGLPPGLITMPDISAIDAVLSSEKHDYLYMVANVENFGYHMFAKTLAQHNRNKEQYIRWINAQNINR